MGKMEPGPSGASEGARRATGEAPEGRAAERGRFSARRKAEAVVRLLRGEDLETLSRALGVTAATLSAWRDAFLAGGTAALKSRQDPDDPRHEELTRLKAKIGDLTMANELLETKIDRLEAGRPLAPRRPRP
jgi:transposase-like protein